MNYSYQEMNQKNKKISFNKLRILAINRIYLKPIYFLADILYAIYRRQISNVMI